MDAQLFLHAFIYLLAAALAAPLGKRLGIGSVLGYLVIGALIGPSIFGIIGSEREEVLHFAEFGVVLMLFVIGLELDLGKLWRMRTSIFGLGGLQLALSTAVLALVGGLIAEDWREALALGLILALSSTAIVMQTLKERGLMETNSGRQSFAVLLFQDIAVIPILALLPLLTYREPVAKKGGDHGTAMSHWFEHLPALGQAAMILGAIGLIIVLGRFLLTPWLNWVARLKVPEALNATTLTLVVGVALLMSSVGLSPALGTFVAGVMLASSSYRHELEGNIEPFKSLLLAVFFLAVGASIDFGLIAEKPGLIAAFVTLLIALKFLVLIGLGKVFKLGFDQSLLFGVALAQGGEFAFVLGGFALANGAMSPELTSLMIASVALSMAISPLLLILMQRGILPRFGTKRSDESEREADVENDHPEIILAGFGRFGHPIIRLLRSVGHYPTVLEKDSDHVDFVRRLGIQTYYGDATRLELLQSAGAAEAKILIIAIDDEDACMQIIDHCRKHFPNLQLLARACSRDHAYRLHEEKVEFFIEQLGSSLDCAIATLDIIGHDLDHAKDAARVFKTTEFEVIGRNAGLRSDEKSYASAVRQSQQDLESLLDNAPIMKAKRGGE
ncbi:MAG: monovalent cation:proton antiporter-2 (CPA2) family protein [Verrucomicrobiota bacterium]